MISNQNNMNRIIERLTLREREAVEAFAAFLMALVMQAGGFDWLNDEEEDIYSIQEGEAPKWGQE